MVDDPQDPLGLVRSQIQKHHAHERATHEVEAGLGLVHGGCQGVLTLIPREMGDIYLGK